MDTLGKLLNSKFTKKSTFHRQVKSGLVVEYANSLIQQQWGQLGAEQIKAVSLRSNKLKIHTTNSIVAQELKFKQNKIINGVNLKFGPNTVERINIVQKGVEQAE
jgi:hypothetical protein